MQRKRSKNWKNHGKIDKFSHCTKTSLWKLWNEEKPRKLFISSKTRDYIFFDMLLNSVKLLLQNSKRLPLQPPLDSRSWASSDSSSNSSTFPSTISSLDRRVLFIWPRPLLAVNLVRNDTTFLLRNVYINFYECAENSILLSVINEFKNRELIQKNKSSLFNIGNG